MREKRVSALHEVFPNEENSYKDDRNDERNVKFDTMPAVGWSLGKAEDEEDESRDKDEDTAEVHSLPLFSAG